MTKTNIVKRLQAFIEENPAGWSHAGWLGLLSALEAEGADVTDADGIGLSLERTRLAETLKQAGVPGLGTKRIDAVVDRFGTLWNLQNASVDEIAGIKTVPAKLAEQVLQAVN